MKLAGDESFRDGSPWEPSVPTGETQLEGVCRLVTRPPVKHSLTAVPLFCSLRPPAETQMTLWRPVWSGFTSPGCSLNRPGRKNTTVCVCFGGVGRGSELETLGRSTGNSLRGRPDFPGSGSRRGTSSTPSSSSQYISKADAANQLAKQRFSPFRLWTLLEAIKVGEEEEEEGQEEECEAEE